MSVPGDIVMLLHYWVSPEPYAADEESHRTSPWCTKKHEEFIRRGLLIERDEPNEFGSQYAAGPALKIWVDALMDVPFPIQRWVIPSDGESE